MPKQTDNFGLGYYTPGEFTDPLTEQRRWTTVDGLLKGLYSIVGDGVISGWGLNAAANNPLTVDILAGSGIISSVSVATAAVSSLGPLVPNAVNYIFASLTRSSYYNHDVGFSASQSSVSTEGHVLIGSVTTDLETVVSTDQTLRRDIGILASVKDLIQAHRHNNAGDNPPPVDLSSGEVQGQLQQENIGELDASVIQTGTVDPNRIPKLDHLTKLLNTGTLTHAQLDSFVQSLSNPKAKLMGDTFLVNLLQLILALKRIGGFENIDDNLVNELTFVPGISSDEIMDFVNTTPSVQTEVLVNKTIRGAEGQAKQVYTKTWSSQNDFNDAYQMRQGNSFFPVVYKTDTLTDGDLVRLQTTVVADEIATFDDVSDWNVSITDLSSGNSATFTTDSSIKFEGTASGRLQVNIDTQSNLALVINKTFASQNWSGANLVRFYLNTAEVYHGDILFYLRDAVAGVQNSYTLVLERGAPTINREDGSIGWREILVDISGYTRSAITEVGFVTSSQTGWDASKPIELHIDQMQITSGNIFSATGFVWFAFGMPSFPQTFQTVRWDALVPSNDSGSSSLKVRTRAGNTLDALMEASWSPQSTTSPFTISQTGNYIQIEVALIPSPDRKVSPELHRLYLDYSSNSALATFTYDAKEQWESGTLVNIDSSSVSGSIQLAGTGDVDSISYGANGSVVKTDQSLNPVLTVYSVTLPQSTPQILNNTVGGLGQISAVAYGDNGTIWVADTDHDRILRLSPDGSLEWGLYGSFLEEPVDVYGMEESGPGSNTGAETPPAFTPSTDPPILIQVVYNPTEGMLNMLFDQPLDLATLDYSKLILSIDSQRVYFGDSTTFSLFGIDAAKAEKWSGSDNEFINQFNFRSHILQAKLAQNDAAMVNSAVTASPPTITAAAPRENQIFQAGVIDFTMIVKNVAIGAASGYRIRTYLDNDSANYAYWSNVNGAQTIISVNGTVGQHVLHACIVDLYDAPLLNVEAELSVNFVVRNTTTPMVDPWIEILSPVQNLAFSNSTVIFEYVSSYPTAKIRYQLDAETNDYEGSSPLILENLSGGRHTVTLTLLDPETNDPFITGYPTATVVFSVGKPRLNADAGFIKNLSGVASTISLIPVEVGNVVFGNVYAPIEVQYLPNEVNPLNLNGDPTIVVGKLRSQSTTTALALNPVLMTGTNIFGSNYLDGHSVVQFDLEGQVVFSNNAAKFAATKVDVKDTLGGAQKISPSELLLADANRQRAIITVTDLETEKPLVSWQYNSDRYVSDCRLVEQEDPVLLVSPTTVSASLTNIKSGMLVTWKNDSLLPLWIYSGATTTEQFAADPDLTLFGELFISPELQPGEQFAYRFLNVGDFNWFVYSGDANIVVGKVSVSDTRVSSLDKYLIVENDPASVLGGRVVRVDAWGNIDWSFGESYIYRPRDVRSMPDGSILLST